jgi:Clostridial hydrophobic W
MTRASLDEPSTMAHLIALEQGLYALEIGESSCMRGLVSKLLVPVVQISAPRDERDRTAEIIGTSGRGDTWLGGEGGTAIVKSPPGGAYVLVTAYGLPAQVICVPDIQVRRLDRPPSLDRPTNGAVLRSIDPADDPEEIGSEIVLHLERLGDRRFPGEGWVGNRGKKLRIEAFSIRPVDTLLARDIEFKALGPKGRQTPWVTDAKLCGTRGQGLPLTGLAIRLAPHVAERFDVVYQGAFFESGVVGPHRNGELCIPPITDDPLEAINVRLIRRSHR